MNRERIRNLFWAYGAQFMNLGAGVIILPLLLKRLTSAEVGFWFVLLTVNSFVVMMDFVFNPTVARNITYLLSGAQQLNFSGLADVTVSAKETSVNEVLLAQVVRTSQRIYQNLALVVLVLFFTLGLYYAVTVTQGAGEPLIFFSSWCLFALGSVLNLYFGYLNAILFGFKKIEESYKVSVFSRALFVLFAVLFILMGWGLIGLAIAQFLMMISARIFSAIYVRRLTLYLKVLQNFVDKAQVKATLKILWYNAQRTGMVALGGFLITRANTLTGSQFLGLSEIASYGLAVQLFSVLSGLALATFSAITPHLSAAWVHEDRNLLRKEVSTAVVLSWFIFICGALVIILAGENVLALMRSQTPLLSIPAMTVMAVAFFLEMNHSNFALVITTKNEVPFVKPALISGVLIITIGVALMKLTDWGVWCLILSQTFVQLAYNNWKWPLLVARDLQLDIIQMLSLTWKGLRPVERR